MKYKRLIILLLAFFLLCSCSKHTESTASTYEDFTEDNLKTATIGLYSGTPMHMEILEKYPNAKLEFLGNTADMVLYLQQHKADCMVIGKSEYINIEGNDTGLTYIDSSFKPILYGCIFSKSKLDVRAQFNEFIKQAKSDGTLEALEQEWVFGSPETRSIDCTYTGENGILRIGTEATHSPMTYVYDNEIVGYEIDLICQFCEKYGYIPQIEDCGWDPMNAGILTERYDIGCSNIMYSKERARESYFSDCYYEDPVYIGYIHPDYIDLSTLSNKTISVVTGSIFDDAIWNVESIKNPNLVYYDNDVNAFNSVISGKSIAGVTDYPLAHYSQLHNLGIKVASDFIYDEHCAFVFRKGFPDIDRFNDVINKFKSDGTVKLLQDKWYNADDSTAPLVQDWPGQSGTIKCMVITGAAPVSFMGADGAAYGFDVDILLHVCKELDYKVEFSLASFATLLSSISAGKSDIGIGGIAKTEERAKALDFSEEVYKSGVVVYTSDETTQTTRENILESLKTNLVKTFITENRWKLFIGGCLITFADSLVSIIAGTILGFAMYLICKRGNKVVNKVADVYTWLIDGMPVVVLLMILYYVIFGNSKLSGLWVSAVGLSLVFASGVLGMLKMGVGAIDKGQEEAGLALGYTNNQTFYKIILPQAARIFLPTYKNEIVQLIKGTSVVGYIAVQDLTKVSDLVRSRTFAPFFPLIVSAVIYFVMAWILTVGVSWLIDKVSPTADRTKRAVYLKEVVR